MTRNDYTRAQLTAAIRACEETEAGPSLDKAIINALMSTDDFKMNWPDDVPLMSEYTSRPYDLTAAMELVPDGACIAWAMNDVGGGEFTVSTEPLSSFRANSPSPSHALTLAALRAQLSLLKE